MKAWGHSSSRVVEAEVGSPNIEVGVIILRATTHQTLNEPDNVHRSPHRSRPYPAPLPQGPHVSAWIATRRCGTNSPPHDPCNPMAHNLQCPSL